MKLSEKDTNPYTRVALFGLPGSGKSTLAAALAKNPSRRLIWFSLDNDADVLRKLSTEEQERVEFVDIPDTAAFPVASQTLLQLFKQGKGKICYAHGNFGCALCNRNRAGFTTIDFTNLTSGDVAVIDTGSQLGRSILAHVTKDESVDYKPERDDWGALRKYTEFFASQFQGFRGNLIVIFHAIEHVTTNSKGEVISSKLIPDFGSKGMAMTVGKNFSHVIFMEVKNKKHRAYSSSTAMNECLTKSRTDFRIEDLDEPSLESLFPIREIEPAIAAPTISETPTSQTITPSNTPAQNAVSSLTDLAARMKAKGITK